MNTDDWMYFGIMVTLFTVGIVAVLFLWWDSDDRWGKHD